MGTVATKGAQAYVAKLLYEQAPNIYIGLGKSSPWNDENNVPNSNPNATALDEPILYTKAQKVLLCKPLAEKTDSSVQFGAKFYEPVPDSTQIDPDANCVFAYSKFNYEDIQKEIQFRQVGLFVGLIPNDRVTSTIILPTQVGALGTLLSISNNKLVNITATSPVTVGAMYSILPILN